MACESSSVNLAGIIFRGYLAGCFCVIAIIGNLLCAIVLSSRKMRASPVNRILLTLSLSDLTFCAINIFETVPNVFYSYYCLNFPVYQFFIYPLSEPWLFPIRVIAQVTSIYLTVLVSCERYLAVCRPFAARTWCTPKRSTICCIFVVIFATLYTLPVWWEQRSVPNIANVTDKSGSRILYEGYEVIDTDLSLNANYYFYYLKWGTFLVFRLGPFISLLIFNAFIFRAVFEMNKRRESMTQSQARDVSITKMLLSVILVFLLCNGVKIYVYIFDLVNSDTFIEVLSDLLVISNPTFNFLIYCLFSKEFRNQFIRIILWRFYTPPPQPMTQITRSNFQSRTISSV